MRNSYENENGGERNEISGERNMKPERNRSTSSVPTTNLQSHDEVTFIGGVDSIFKLLPTLSLFRSGFWISI